MFGVCLPLSPTCTSTSTYQLVIVLYTLCSPTTYAVWASFYGMAGGSFTPGSKWQRKADKSKKYVCMTKRIYLRELAGGWWLFWRQKTGRMWLFILPGNCMHSAQVNCEKTHASQWQYIIHIFLACSIYLLSRDCSTAPLSLERSKMRVKQNMVGTECDKLKRQGMTRSQLSALGFGYSAKHRLLYTCRL